MSLKVPGLFHFVIFLKVRIKFLFASVVGLKRQTPLTLVIRQIKNFKRVTAPTPTTKPVTDFHRQDVTHAGRTIKRHLPAMRRCLET